MDPPLPGRRRGESAVDWMTRCGLARSAQAAAEALIVAQGLEGIRDALLEAQDLADCL